MEEELKKVLRSMPDYYYDFELGILLLLEDNNEAMADTIDYIKNNPDANTGDVLKNAHQFVEFVYEDE